MPKRKKKKAPADPSRYATTSIPSRSGPANANAQVDGAAAVEQQRASDANGHGEEREEREEAESVMVPLDAEARARLEQKLLGMLQGKASLRKLQHTIQRLQHPNANCAWFRTSDQSSVELQGGGDGVRLCVGCGDGSYEMSMVLGGRCRNITHQSHCAVHPPTFSLQKQSPPPCTIAQVEGRCTSGHVLRERS
eukprot:SAG11_NODE_234_length_11857_cov_15.265776_10_plen_194_part_00